MLGISEKRRSNYQSELTQMKCFYYSILNTVPNGLGIIACGSSEMDATVVNVMVRPCSKNDFQHSIQLQYFLPQALYWHLPVSPSCYFQFCNLNCPFMSSLFPESDVWKYLHHLEHICNVTIRHGEGSQCVRVCFAVVAISLQSSGVHRVCKASAALSFTILNRIQIFHLVINVSYPFVAPVSVCHVLPLITQPPCLSLPYRLGGFLNVWHFRHHVALSLGPPCDRYERAFCCRCLYVKSRWHAVHSIFL